jgi:exportin-T
MVVCLEEELLPYVPQASEGLLKGSDIQSIQEYIPLIVQIIAKFKVSCFLSCVVLL